MGKMVKVQNPRVERDSHWAYRTLEETGRLMGISKQAVEQIERKLLVKLRYRLRVMMELEGAFLRGEIGPGEQFRQLCRWYMQSEISDSRSAVISARKAARKASLLSQKAGVARKRGLRVAEH